MEIDVPGATLHCREAGPAGGPPVVMFHGFPDCADSWAPAADALAARGKRVIMPYLRGYSPSTVGGRHDPATLFGDVIAVLDHIKAEKATLVGHDWGAMLVYGAAALHPGRVSKLVTIAIPHPAAIRMTPKRLWQARHFVAFQLPGAAARLRKDDFAGVSELMRRWSPGWDPPASIVEGAKRALRPPGAAEAAIDYYRSFRLVKALRGPIDVETITIVGDNDPFMAAAESERAKRFFPRGLKVISLAGGHFVHLQDSRFPEVLADAIG